MQEKYIHGVVTFVVCTINVAETPMTVHEFPNHIDHYSVHTHVCTYILFVNAFSTQAIK